MDKKKPKTHIYAVYKRFTSDLKTNTQAENEVKEKEVTYKWK